MIGEETSEAVYETSDLEICETSHFKLLTVRKTPFSVMHTFILNFVLIII